MQRLICLLALLGAGACATALPQSDPTKDMQGAVDSAVLSAKNARSAADEAKAEREKGEKLLSEARSLLASAEQSRARCEALIKRIPKRPPAPPKPAATDAAATPSAAPATTPGAAAPAAAAPGVAAPATPGAPAVAAPAKPQYSPSDAPLTPAELEILKKLQQK